MWYDVNFVNEIMWKISTMCDMKSSHKLQDKSSLEPGIWEKVLRRQIAIDMCFQICNTTFLYTITFKKYIFNNVSQ